MAEYIDREELFGMEKLLDTEILRASKVASSIYDQMMYDIEHISSADVAPVKHGKWLSGELDFCNCSVCGNEIPEHAISPYCDECGAKMDGE